MIRYQGISHPGITTMPRFVHWTDSGGSARPFQFGGGFQAPAGSIPENYHVTLRFIGDIDGLRPTKSLDAVSNQSKPSSGACRACRSFGGRKPRAVVASVCKPPLIELAGGTERLMQRVGPRSRGADNFTATYVDARLRGAVPNSPSLRSNQDLLADLPVGYRCLIFTKPIGYQSTGTYTPGASTGSTCLFLSSRAIPAAASIVDDCLTR